MAIKDLKLKQEIKNNGIDTSVRCISGLLWKNEKRLKSIVDHVHACSALGLPIDTNALTQDIQHYVVNGNELKKALENAVNNDLEILRVSKNLNNSYYKRTRTIKSKIEKMFQCKSRELVFLTMTFTDNDLQRTSAPTRREYIQDFLNKNTDYYIANIDFGKKREREHFHAIALLPFKVDHNEYHKYFEGNINFKSVYNDNSEAIAKYINKLTNHAIKDTTKDCRTMFPKSKNLDYLVASELVADASSLEPLKDFVKLV